MESVNIVKLIEDNPITTLSKFYQGNLLNKIKNNFDTEEQKMFITSFYCYLRLKKEDFIIDLDEIWKWLGFSQKIRAKELLQKHFKEDLEYKILLSSTREQKEENRGGKNKEIIMLTIKTFKKLCLKANTSKADQIHDYYIKLEEVLHQTIMEESSELREQLEQKDSELRDQLEQKDNELDESNKKIKGNEKRIRHLENRILVKQTRAKHKERNVIYMVQDEFHKRDRIYVIGKAINLNDRVNSYNKTREHEVVYYKECNSAQQLALIETCILYKLDKYREVSNRDRFHLPEDQDISLFTNIIDLFINFFDDVDMNVDIYKDLSEEELLYKKQEANREYYEDNKEYVLIKKKEYIEENREKYDEYHKNYREENKDVLNILCKNHYQQNKEDHAKKCKEYREENKEQISFLQKNYYEEHKDEFTKYKKEYYDQNKEAVIDRSKEYYKEHKDEVLVRTKEHYNENKETILNYQKEKIICECGMKIARNYMAKHKRTKVHTLSIENKLNKINFINDSDGKVNCECGANISVSCLTRHLNSKLHISNIQIKEKKNKKEEIKNQIEGNDTHEEETKIKITCECGIKLKVINKQHLESKKHQNFINSKKI